MAISWRSSGEPGLGPAVPLGREAPGLAAARPAAWRVLTFAAAVPLLLRAMKLPRLGRWLEPAAGPAAAPSEVGADAAAVAALVERIDRLLAAGRPLVRRGCLTRGVTLYRFLRAAGADVALCFGIGRPEGDLAGHCWIEHGGAPLAESRDPRGLYVETYRIGPAAAGDRAAPAAEPAGDPARRTARSRVP